MATLQEKIIEKFVTELYATADMSEEKIAALRALLGKTDAKLKPDDLVELFTRDDGDVA